MRGKIGTMDLHAKVITCSAMLTLLMLATPAMAQQQPSGGASDGGAIQGGSGAPGSGTGIPGAIVNGTTATGIGETPTPRVHYPKHHHHHRAKTT
jgi:hypothetical protein